jgi:amino acid transporter
MEGMAMKPMAIVGVVLVVLGIAGLVFGRFSYSTDKQVIDVGPITASVSEQHHVDVPDITSVGAVIAGALLVFFSRRTA